MKVDEQLQGRQMHRRTSLWGTVAVLHLTGVPCLVAALFSRLRCRVSFRDPLTDGFGGGPPTVR